LSDVDNLAIRILAIWRQRAVLRPVGFFLFWRRLSVSLSTPTHKKCSQKIG